MFAYAPARIEIVTSHKCTCGNGNCKHAKKIRCTCKCHSLHHGEENRVSMEPLDKTLGLDALIVIVTYTNSLGTQLRP